MTMSTTDWRPIWPCTGRSHWAGCREAKQPMRWDHAELSNYNKVRRSLKMSVVDFRRVSSVSTFLFTTLSRREIPIRHAVQDRQRAAIDAEPVWNLAIVTNVKHRQVGVFASFHAALAVG